VADDVYVAWILQLLPSIRGRCPIHYRKSLPQRDYNKPPLIQRIVHSTFGIGV
jgi:hypothetical protein